MAGFQDGHKLKGRFIKRGSKVLDHVALVDFSFSEICEAPVVSHDNTDSSIIHTKYHRKEDIDLAVRTPPKFDQNLLSDSQVRPVIQPLDFTGAWRRDQKRQKERIGHSSSEDELVYDDFEAAYAEEVANHKKNRERSRASQKIVENEEAKKTEEFVSAQPEITDDPRRARSEFESVDYAGKVIKDLQTEKAAAPESAIVEPPTEVGIKEPAIETLASTQSDEFIPTAGGLSDAPEKAAADEYKNRLQAQQRSMDQIMGEAKAQGYEEGFKQGEEKAAIQSRAQAQAIFGKLGELFAEFANLKKEVLNNVQQNFYEISQAIAESLLKRELEINPQAFASVVRRAIDETVEADKFKVRVHPETFASLKALADDSMLANLVRDESIAQGDFKIESDLSVVDGSISKLVRELLDRADLSLFDEEKAG